MLLGYALPAKKKDMDEDLQLISEDEVRKLIDKELEDVKDHISDIVDEAITYAIEKTERSMERLANEKIMAINEYSDTVLEEINKNHKEVLFLYDMLNDKHDSLKEVVSEANKTVEEVKQTLKDAEITAREAEETAKEVEETVKSRVVENVKSRAVENVKNKIDTVFDDDFVPIMPPRVEIIHDPDAEYDYVAPKEPTFDMEELRQFIPVNQFESKDFQTDGNYGNETSGMEIFGNESEYMSQVDENENTRNSNDRIRELHKAGKSNMAIAKELGLGIGEVKLVIDLFEGL